MENHLKAVLMKWFELTPEQERLRLKLLKEELRKRKKQPAHWAKSKYRFNSVFADLYDKERKKKSKKFLNRKEVSKVFHKAIEKAKG